MCGIAGLLVGLLRRGVERLIVDLADAARTDHARLYAAERAARLEADRATESLRRLQQVTDVALTHLELEELLDELLGRVVEVLPVDTAAIMLLEDDRNLVVRAARGIDEEVWRGLRIRVGEGFGGRRVGLEQVPLHVDEHLALLVLGDPRVALLGEVHLGPGSKAGRGSRARSATRRRAMSPAAPINTETAQRVRNVECVPSRGTR